MTIHENLNSLNKAFDENRDTIKENSKRCLNSIIDEISKLNKHYKLKGINNINELLLKNNYFNEIKKSIVKWIDIECSANSWDYISGIEDILIKLNSIKYEAMKTNTSLPRPVLIYPENQLIQDIIYFSMALFIKRKKFSHLVDFLKIEIQGSCDYVFSYIYEKEMGSFEKYINKEGNELKVKF